MIHSLAGGNIQNLKVADFAKVQITQGAFAGDIFWFIACGTETEGDTVIVPIGKNNTLTQGKVLRVDKNVNSQVSPVPFSRAKKVVRVIK